MDKTDHITSCTFEWHNCGLTYVENIKMVKTRILSSEIQVCFYNGYGLVNGKRWPLSDQQRQELFGFLDNCLHEWKTDDYSIDVCDGSSWELKLFSKRKCLRNIQGTVENPPHGQEIRDMITNIIGNDDCYVF